MKRILSIGLGLLALASCGAAGLKPGDEAPAFEALDQQGRAVRLADYRGKTAVVLYFYPKDGTPGCTAQACSLRDGHRALAQAGAAVIGVSADTRESHEAFARKHNLPFPILADPGRDIIRRYGVAMPLIPLAKRVTFIIDRSGRIAAVIRDPRTADHDRQVLDVIARLK